MTSNIFIPFTMEDLELGALPHSKISFTDGTVSNPEPHRPQRTVSQNPKSKWRSSSFYRDNLWFPDWPGVKELIRKEWPDFLLLTIITILPLMLFLFAMPLVPKYFTLNDGHLAYPKRKEYINTFMSILIGIAVPIVIIVPISIFLIGSFWDMHGAVSSSFSSILTSLASSHLLATQAHASPNSLLSLTIEQFRLHGKD